MSESMSTLHGPLAPLVSTVANREVLKGVKVYKGCPD